MKLIITDYAQNNGNSDYSKFKSITCIFFYYEEFKTRLKTSHLCILCGKRLRQWSYGHWLVTQCEVWGTDLETITESEISYLPTLAVQFWASYLLSKSLRFLSVQWSSSYSVDVKVSGQGKPSAKPSLETGVNYLLTI